jgi:hypothetical protein
MVPNMTKDWIVRPITLAGDQELIIEDGVVITAKRGEYRSYGATVRMQKEDYIYGRAPADLTWDGHFGQCPRAVIVQEKRTIITFLIGIQVPPIAVLRPDERTLENFRNLSVFGDWARPNLAPADS